MLLNSATKGGLRGGKRDLGEAKVGLNKVKRMLAANLDSIPSSLNPDKGVVSLRHELVLLLDISLPLKGNLSPILHTY